MSSDSPVDVGIRFVESINRRDLDGLVALMPPDHKLFPGGGDVITGREKARDALSDYVSSWPEFQIHISDIYLVDNAVVMIGRTTGSCADTPKGIEIQERRIYVAKVEDGFVKEFHHLDDSDQVRKEFGVSAEKRITK
ncbi:hypothetical protein AMJ71_02440 [candidate division TA06 bacterium SM1_40]|uniref:SnoaL-like domain-containing protein n=1 Tax=candidate division TA06 bacterium SM1_40 TaxID=1703773 RepID=A0A0S8JLR3_UNCT6|nr:MAG: hypothetical protein AMJ71_02440 [candidate division TA06 bacterium SM1_40]